MKFKAISYLLVSFSAFLLLSPSAAAFSETQSDWSGPGEYWDPVVHWSDTIFTSIDLNRSFSQPELSLMPERNFVTLDFPSAGTLCLMDVSGNGHSDIIGASQVTGIAWWENLDGTGLNWEEHAISTTVKEVYCIACGDIDGDNLQDVVAVSLDGNSVLWYRNNNNGASWTENVIADDFWGAYGCNTADVDSDGDMDVLAAAHYDDELAWWENLDGTGTSWTKHVIRDSLDRASGISVGDLNHDGHTDILAISAEDVAGWWENTDGSGTVWIEHLLPETEYTGNCITARDLDQDGYSDIVFGADELLWYRNSDTVPGIFVLGDEIETEMSSWYRDQVIIDMNGDGLLDIAAASVWYNSLIWFENMDPSCTEWTPHPVSCYAFSGLSLDVYDFNGDGVPDILGQNKTGGDIFWCDITKYQSPGTMLSAVLDANTSADWLELSWIGQEPSGTSISLEVRSGSVFEEMREWHTASSNPFDLSGVLTQGDNLVQYRATLETTDPSVTPLLSSVTVEWDHFTGIEREDSGETAALLGVFPNPTAADAVIRFSLPEMTQVSVHVYDIYGRMVYRVISDYQTGINEVQVSELAGGIYFAGITSESGFLCKRFVVTR